VPSSLLSAYDLGRGDTIGQVPDLSPASAVFQRDECPMSAGGGSPPPRGHAPTSAVPVRSLVLGVIQVVVFLKDLLNLARAGRSACPKGSLRPGPGWASSQAAAALLFLVVVVCASGRSAPTTSRVRSQTAER